MTTVALAEAKNKLSELLDRVEQGEEFIITRHDDPIARLVPAKRPSRDTIKKAIRAMQEFRKGSRVTIDEIVDWRNQGRP